ncbi:MAG: sugar ABC transporter substrate-binding protein [Christensenellaceae bacterium]|jgi:ribose transport system substrate-binding protein
MSMKKNALKVLTTVLSLMLVLAIVGCGSPAAAPSESASAAESSAAPSESVEASTEASAEATPSEETAEAKDFTISFIVATTNNPFYVSMEEGARRKAEELKEQGINVTLEVAGPQKETDLESLTNFFMNSITKKVDGICICPSDSQAIIPVLKTANEAGIPVILMIFQLDEKMVEQEGVEYLTWIGSDNYETGVLAGEKMGEYFEGEEGPIEIAVLEGVAGTDVSELRCGGFKDGVAKFANCEVVTSQPADWVQENGFNVFQNILQANPNIKGVFAASDLMAVGAAQAAEAAGKGGEIIIMGVDYHESAQAAIKEGIMYGSVAHYPDNIGAVCVQTMIDHLLDPSAPVEPVIITDMELVTADMM